MLNWLRFRVWLAEREEGQDLVEYALLIVVIALVVVLAMPTLTDAISAAYDNIAAALGS
jgi:Flp pilus assembly pilin Flp